MRFTNIMIFWR